ncbi:polysaccharide biosynthesis protein, partial [Pseudoalteromonas sp. S1650]
QYFYAPGDISQNRLLQDGDIVQVSRKDMQKVFVLGDVKRDGTVVVNRYGLNLAQALMNDGGLIYNTSDSYGVLVLRNSILYNNVVI